ncbi:MAG: sialate O-acetylesterase [Muribaculum sp.]|nr:sialate O-acetylesterase [Muribaculum sp.]
MNTKTICMLILMLFVTIPSFAKVTLPAVFSDNMVLQQNTLVNIRGTAKQGREVIVAPTWTSSTYTAVSDSAGKWCVAIPTPEAGGPFSVKVSDGDELNINNVLVGEVWFCSGQSNMEMPLRGFDRQPIDNAADYISKAKPSKNIRAFVTDSRDGLWIRQFSKTPLDDMEGEWVVNSPEKVANVSAIAYLFADYLNEVLDVPVGVLVSTLGGSRIEPWLSEEVASLYPEVSLEHLKTDMEIQSIHNDACVLFNGKVAPLQTFPIKGMLWYQGESNRDNPELYEKLLPSMIRDYRQTWNCGEFPVYVVEIAPFNYEGPEGVSAARFREAQTAVVKSTPNCEIVSTLDVGHPVFIHPTDKATVADRLARLALVDTYGKSGYSVKSPVYNSLDIQGKRVYVNVDNAPHGLYPMWTEIEGFEIAGPDRIFHPAKAEIETSTCRLVVWNDEIDNPVAVRYAYHNYPKATVFDTYGLPLLPFRSDKW